MVFKRIPLLVDTGATTSILGRAATKLLSPSEITAFAINGIAGVTKSYAQWTGLVSFAGIPTELTVFLLPDYPGGLLIGDNIQSQLDVTIRTDRKELRTTVFGSLNVQVSYHMRTGIGNWSTLSAEVSESGHSSRNAVSIYKVMSTCMKARVKLE